MPLSVKAGICETSKVAPAATEMTGELLILAVLASLSVPEFTLTLPLRALSRHRVTLPVLVRPLTVPKTVKGKAAPALPMFRSPVPLTTPNRLISEPLQARVSALFNWIGPYNDWVF